MYKVKNEPLKYIMGDRIVANFMITVSVPPQWLSKKLVFPEKMIK